MTHFLKKPKGFSLIEVLIALIILSISLLGLATLMATTIKYNSFGGHMTEAATFAQDRLEQLKTTTWEKLASGFDQMTGSTGIVYSRNWKVVPNPDDTLRTVTITINWTDKSNHSIRFSYVLSR
jgi:type IV pilus assembly protein PilV